MAPFVGGLESVKALPLGDLSTRQGAARGPRRPGGRPRGLRPAQRPRGLPQPGEGAAAALGPPLN